MKKTSFQQKFVLLRNSSRLFCMKLRKIFLGSIAILLLMGTNACDWFESHTLSSTQIKKASSWSAVDQPPTYPECESLEKEEQMECFQDLISQQLLASIAEAELMANAPVEASISVLLKIDKSGSFSILETYISNAVATALPDLQRVLEEAVLNLPQALPATKTNVGIYVDTQIALPIQIRALPIDVL
jgi:hypothetical protein